MLISVFSKATGLSQDTIRFYVRKGLLRPSQDAMGGRNPYQQFSERDIQTARLVRFAQALGMPLKEIAAVNDEMLSGNLPRERAMELMDEQIAKLDQKAAELAALSGYLRAKKRWIADGEQGDEPRLDGSIPCQLDKARQFVPPTIATDALDKSQ